VLPIAGRIFSKDFKAYEYLPASIQLVPQGIEMTKILINTGFEHAEFTPYTFGICTMYTGTKPI